MGDDEQRGATRGATRGEKILVFGTLFVVIPFAIFATWYWR